MVEQEAVLRALQAHDELLRKFRHEGRRQASPEELALLDPFKDKLPPEVFGEPYTPPVTDGSGNNRDNLKKARDLLIGAGWKPGPDGKLRNDKGEQLTIEFLDFEAQFERITLPYTENLKRIGVDASWRLVDSSQYQERLKSFDFDVTTQRFSLGLTPGVDMRTYLSCDAAKANGSYNLAGICDPVIDALIDKIIAAKSRAELTTATRVIDRVLRAGHYWVPHWYKPAYSVAYWNKFSRRPPSRSMIAACSTPGGSTLKKPRH